MKYHIAGIGNPLLDLTLSVNDNFLKELNVKKGSMRLVNSVEASSILKKVENYKINITPGGSTANVLAGASSLGGRTVLLGKIGLDKYGKIYHQKTKSSGIDTNLVSHKTERTGYAITFITPDKERTFIVHPGAASHFEIEDINNDSIRNSHFLHIEGFKIEDCQLNGAINYAAKVAKKNNTSISVDLSDSELVKRNLQYLKKFIKENVNIVFANEEESKAFTGKKEIDALNEIYKICDIAVVKLGERGSLIKHNNIIHKIPAYKTKVKNLNGAGDMYAAGVLFGLINGVSLDIAGDMASYIASIVIAKNGARAEMDLSDMINKKYNLK